MRSTRTVLISETNVGAHHHAGSKARVDAEKIMQREGIPLHSITFPPVERERLNGLGRLREHLSVFKHWIKGVDSIGEGDTLIMQYPPVNHTVLFSAVLRRIRKRGVRLVFIVHDADYLRYRGPGVPKARSWRAMIEDKTSLKYANDVVVHNPSMKRALLEDGVLSTASIVEIGLFDYLVEGDQGRMGEHRRQLPLVIAGNLNPEKALYVYHLPQGISFKLYGPEYEPNMAASENEYVGSFPPDVLPTIMDGSFGVVWDGEATDTCTGSYGQYLRYNNPHKLSLYLAAGMPVIVWSESAVAAFVESEGVGICVNSLDDLPRILDGIDDEHYELMASNATKVGMSVRSGAYLGTALAEILQAHPSHDSV